MVQDVDSELCIQFVKLQHILKYVTRMRLDLNKLRSDIRPPPACLVDYCMKLLTVKLLM